MRVEYNRRQIRTRNIVERTIGIWKRKFACLTTKLQYTPEKVGAMIVACAVLHNIAIDHKEPIDYDPDPLPVVVEPAHNSAFGVAARNAFIEI